MKYVIILVCLFFYFKGFSCDCDFSSFDNMVKYSAITIKGTVINKVNDPVYNYGYFPYTKYIELKVNKRYYGYDGRDTIKVEAIDMTNTCADQRIGRLEVGEKLLINLFKYGENYKLGTCGETVLSIKNDSIQTLFNGRFSLLSLEQKLNSKLGPFVQDSLRLINSDNLNYLDMKFESNNKGKMALKNELSDGAYFVYSKNNSGFTIIEEAYYRDNRKIGKHKKWFLSGNIKLKSFYNLEGNLDGYYSSFYDCGEVHLYEYHFKDRKESFEFNNGEKFGKQLVNWENKNDKLEEYYTIGSDSIRVKKWSIDGKLLFEGHKVKNQLIGEFRTYHENGNIENAYYKDKNGIQGLVIILDDSGKDISIINYLNNKFHGKVIRGKLKRSLDFKLISYSKGKLNTNIKYELYYNIDYKNGMRHGKEIYYEKKKVVETNYYENGKFLKCEGECYEF